MVRVQGIPVAVILPLLVTSSISLEHDNENKDRQSLVKEAIHQHYESFGQRMRRVVGKLAAAADKGKVVNISRDCTRDIATWSYELIIGKDWARRMSDAWGRPQSGYLEGDSVWEGSWPQCSRVNDVESGIRGRHCLTGWFGIMIYDGFGTCLPSSCSEKDVRQYLIDGVDDLEGIMPPLWRILGMENSNTHCSIPTNEKNITKDASAMAAIGVLGFFGLLTVIGTIYDLATMKRRESRKTALPASEPKSNDFHIPRPSVSGSLSRNGIQTINPAFDYQTEVIYRQSAPDGVVTNWDSWGVDQQSSPQVLDPHGASQGFASYPVTDTSDRNVPPHSPWGKPVPTQQVADIPEKPWQPNTGGKFLLAFSIRQHVPKMLSFEHPKGSITCLNGVRFLAFAWIVLGHAWILGIGITRAPTIANKQTFLDNRPTQMAIRNMALSVESFFILSAMLTTINFLKKLQKRKPNCEMMGIYFFHRYWRLTPVYMLLLMFYGCLFDYLASGPFYRGPEVITDASNCKQYFWKHLIYMNNLIDYKVETECMGWTWYLANDFQFYVISPLFLFPLFYIPAFGIVLSALAICGGMTANIYLSHLQFIETNPDGSPKANFFSDIYIKPWTRCITYFMGILLGYILWKFDFKVKMNKGGVAVGWILIIVLSCTVIYVQYSGTCIGCSPWPDRGNVAFQSLDNLGFGIVICWVIFACSTGYGGFINSILSWNGWLPFARLSYAGYLFHPILCYFYYYQRPVQFYMNDMDMVFLFCGFLFLSLGAAFLISLFLEMPFLALEKLMFANTPGNRKPREEVKPPAPPSYTREQNKTTYK